jgi:DNA-binding response OmpR family regulator
MTPEEELALLRQFFESFLSSEHDSRREVMLKHRVLRHLSPKQSRIFWLLYTLRPQPVPITTIQIAGYNLKNSHRIFRVDKHIYWLRKKLDSTPFRIMKARNDGYYLMEINLDRAIEVYIS